MCLHLTSKPRALHALAELGSTRELDLSQPAAESGTRVSACETPPARGACSSLWGQELLLQTHEVPQATGLFVPPALWSGKQLGGKCPALTPTLLEHCIRHKHVARWCAGSAAWTYLPIQRLFWLAVYPAPLRRAVG